MDQHPIDQDSVRNLREEISSTMSTSDTMKKYETGVDRGDQNESASQPDSPAQTPAPTNDQSDSTPSAPIPQAEPQSPVQTESSPNVSPSKDVHEHSGERGADNLSGQEKNDATNREYREVKDSNL